MARYGGSIVSQAAQASGLPVTTTVNGYMGCWASSASSGFRLRRVQLGVITPTGVPTSQQIRVGLFRQTVTPSGTGVATAVLGLPLETHTPQTDPTVGLIAITAATIGTTGPTIGTNPLATFGFNSQSTLDLPYEFLEEIIAPLGAGNGIAFVNLGAAYATTTNVLPASHQITIGVEVEV